MTKIKVISLWLDKTSQPDHPAWVVSRDCLDSHGGVLYGDTLASVSVDTEDAYEKARATAIAVAAKEGLRVVLEDDA